MDKSVEKNFLYKHTIKTTILIVSVDPIVASSGEYKTQLG